MGSGRNSRHYYSEDALSYSGQQTLEQYKRFHELVSELDALEKENPGLYKHTSNEIISITKDPHGRIIWLEKGNSHSGFQHIVNNHLTDFERIGIGKDEIPNYVMTAVANGMVVGTQGLSRPIYEFIYNGVKCYVAVQIGSNGYIVGANPSKKKGE